MKCAHWIPIFGATSGKLLIETKKTGMTFRSDMPRTLVTEECGDAGERKSDFDGP